MASMVHAMQPVAGMRMVVVLAALVLAPAVARADNITVFMDRGGMLDEGGLRVKVPGYRGDKVTWQTVVRCVQRQFAPFAIDVVDAKPAGEHIRVVVGGKASMLGRDDATTNGFGRHDPRRILRDATVHVFSELGTGERDVENLCARPPTRSATRSASTTSTCAATS